MTRHFGVLIPSSNTICEIEFNRLLPPSLQAHIGRLQVSSVDEAGFLTQDADIDYQARLLATAKVELVILIQTSASFFRDGYDAAVTRRISAAAGVPAFTAAEAVGRAVRALKLRRIAQVSPYSNALGDRARHYFETEHGLEIVGLEGFNMTDANAIGRLGPELADAAFARVDRPEVEALVLPGGNFQTMTSIARWERMFGKPVVTTNQAALWAMLGLLGVDEKLPGFGRLLDEMPPGYPSGRAA